MKKQLINLGTGEVAARDLGMSGELFELAHKAMKQGHGGVANWYRAMANFQYTEHSQGFHPLREHWGQAHGVHSSRVFSIPGVRDGVWKALEFINGKQFSTIWLPDREVVGKTRYVGVMTPFYFRYNLGLIQRGYVPVPIPVSPQGELDMEVARALLKRGISAILVGHAHLNPWGCSLKNLNELLNAAKGSAPVIIDDTYQQMSYDGVNRVLNLGAMDCGEVFLLTGLAKILREVPANLILSEAVDREAFSQFYMSGTHTHSMINQEMLYWLIGNGHFEEHLSQLKAENSKVMDIVAEWLKSIQDEIGEEMFVLGEEANSGGYFQSFIFQKGARFEWSGITRQLHKGLEERGVSIKPSETIFQTSAWGESKLSHPKYPKHVDPSKTSCETYEDYLDFYFYLSGVAPEVRKRIESATGGSNQANFYRLGCCHETPERVEAAMRALKDVIVKIATD